MFQNELADYANDLLLSHNARIADYFSNVRIAQLLKEHTSKQKDHHRILWQLVVLEDWLGKNSVE
jgi:asparagine synthase (glutamine-hydrolysing)